MNVQSINHVLQVCAPFAAPAIMLVVGSICWSGGLALKEKPVLSYLFGVSGPLLGSVGFWLMFVAADPEVVRFVPPTATLGIMTFCIVCGIWMFASLRRDRARMPQQATAPA